MYWFRRQLAVLLFILDKCCSLFIIYFHILFVISIVKSFIQFQYTYILPSVILSFCCNFLVSVAGLVLLYQRLPRWFEVAETSKNYQSFENATKTLKAGPRFMAKMIFYISR